MIKKFIGLLFIFVLTLGLSTTVFANESVREKSDYFTLDHDHINMIQKAFDNIVPPPNLVGRMENGIDPQEMCNILSALLAPVYSAIDEIVDQFIDSTNLYSRSNAVLNEIFIGVNHEVFCGVRVSIEVRNDFIVTNVAYSAYISDLEAFLMQNIVPFSPYNRLASNTVHVRGLDTTATAISLRSQINYFRRDDGAIFIRVGSRWGSVPFVDNRLVSRFEIGGGHYHNNGTINASSTQNFPIDFIRANGSISREIWLVNVRP